MKGRDRKAQLWTSMWVGRGCLLVIASTLIIALSLDSLAQSSFHVFLPEYKSLGGGNRDLRGNITNQQQEQMDERMGKIVKESIEQVVNDKNFDGIDGNIEMIDMRFETLAKEITSPSPGYPSRFCSRDELRDGKWGEIDHNATPPYIPDDYHRNCYKGTQLEGYYRSSWTAPCRFDEFSPERFCELAGNKTIAFLGDSISWQQSVALRMILNATSPKTEKYRNNFHVEACSGTTKIYWERMDYIEDHKVKANLDKYNPDILVLNRGIWYTPDDDLIPALNSTLSTVKTWKESSQDEKIVVWRTTAPGAPQCYHKFEPIKTSLDQYLREVVSNASLPWYHMDEKRRFHFNWWDIERQNQVVMKMILNSGISFELIDAFEMYTARPDLRRSQHQSNNKDCLHQCLPGVPDESNRVLQHILEVRAATAVSAVA